MLIVIPIWLLADFACKDITINWSDKQKQRARNAAALTGWKRHAKVCAHVRRAACQSTNNMKRKTKNNEQKENYIFFCMLVHAVRTRTTSPRMAERHPSAKPPQRLQAPSNGRIGLSYMLIVPLLKAHSATNAKPMGTKKGIPLNPNLLLTLNLIPWKTHCKVIN